MKTDQKKFNDPYWWSQAKPELIDELEWQTTSDVLIVGAGYTGLSAALTLLKSGLKVIIIDSELPGYGASSRNGGITSGKIKPSFKELVSKFGLDLSKKMIKEGEVARQDLYDFIRKESSNKKKEKEGNLIKNSLEKIRDFLTNFTYSFNTLRTVKFLIFNKDKSFGNQSYQYKDKESIDYTFSFINKVMQLKSKKKTLIIIPAKKDMRFNQSNKKYKNLYWFKELELMSQKLDFKLIDLNDVFNIKNINEYFHSCDGHWSTYGNSAAAEHFLSHRKYEK